MDQDPMNPAPGPQQPQSQPPMEPQVGPQNMPDMDSGMTPPEKKSGALTWLIIILLIILIGGGAYYYFAIYSSKTSSNSSTTVAPETTAVTEDTTTTDTTTTTTTPTSTSTGTSTGTSDIAKTYQSTTAIKPTAVKSIALDKDLFSVLKTTFTDVKLKEDLNGTMLTYVVNRPIVAADVTSVLSALVSAGYVKKTADNTGFTVTKGGVTYVFTFPVGSTTEANIEVTF